jgi:hypothetical protein
MGKLAHRAVEKTAPQTRVGPDPLTIVLPALSALGCVAGIAALNWAAHETGRDRRRGRRGSQMILRDLKRDCADLAETFRRLVRGLPGITSGGGTTSLPIKFGVHGLDVTDDTYPLFQSLLSSLASLILRASQNSYELMGAIEDGAVTPPEELFYAFADQQERLNQLLSQRPSLKATIETGYDIAVKLTGLVEELGEYRTE